MLQITLYVILGIFFGISLSFLLFNVVTAKELKNTKRLAMFAFYKEIITKKQDNSYKYSQDARRIINAAHIQNISKWNSHNK